MTNDTTHLDATGLLCPLPVLKARKRLMAVASGARLSVRTDDPAAVIDVPHFCAEAGHVLIRMDADGSDHIFIIQKK